MNASEYLMKKKENVKPVNNSFVVQKSNKVRVLKINTFREKEIKQTEVRQLKAREKHKN